MTNKPEDKHSVHDTVHDTGYRVPEGFFEQAYRQIAEAKGPYPDIRKRERPTIWNRVRPYVYLAAMFAGIWCMMKMFTMMSYQAGSSDVSLDNPPALIAEAMQQTDVVKELSYSNDIYSTTQSDYELENEVGANYSDFQQFEQEFGYEFSDRYANIQIPDNLL